MDREKIIVGSHLVKEIHEVDMEETANGFLLKYLIVFLCNIEMEAAWEFTDEQLDELDELGLPYDPVAPGEWVEVEETPDGGKQVHSAKKRGGYSGM